MVGRGKKRDVREEVFDEGPTRTRLRRSLGDSGGDLKESWQSWSEGKMLRCILDILHLGHSGKKSGLMSSKLSHVVLELRGRTWAPQSYALLKIWTEMITEGQTIVTRKARCQRPMFHVPKRAESWSTPTQ